MHSLPTRPLWAVVAAAVGVAVALGGPGALPARAAPSVSPEVLQAMRRDFRLSEGQVYDRVTDEAAAARAATRVRGRVGDRIAGLWFDPASGTLNAAVANDTDAALVREAGAVAHRVRYGRAELDAAAREVTRTVGKGVPGVVSWGPDDRNDRIEITLDRAAADPSATAYVDAFVARIAALGPIAHISESADSPRQQSDVVGGEKWIPGTESPCSIGFPVTRTSGGTKAFLTAGHCTNDADQAAYGKDGSRVGTSNRNGVGSVNAREGDMGIVDVDQAGWNVVPTVSGYGQGDVTVTGSAEAVVGTAVCRSGQTTGMRCGEVTKVNQSVDYGNVVIEGLSYTSTCSAGGDSGGSYVAATGGKAVGLHSGGGSATCTSGSGEKFTIFQPVNEALATFGASLVTSNPQPGAVTVAAVSAQSGVVGSAVELKNSAEGGAAPYIWSASGLPAGLSIAAATGTVTGTPTTAGTSHVTVTATDRAGATGAAAFTWTVTTVTGSSPTLRDPGQQVAYIGKPVSLALQASGGTKPYVFKAVALPSGLSVDPATGVVSGSPTTWGFGGSTLTVTDAAGKSAVAQVAWNVYF
ncbi:putative Ig domain-containing protein [Streptomyces sp. G-G2]|uniref:putative Ig domain-containing protein n=1 Tax=Streptomyces sp. G-G2 TaxID=3046201 RepID=UPI0024BAF1DE|nr:putative Ig domain-containing protein [Streptomyces sp. G-G2]MDJ0385157.1 putative Ig domain-containing protein [Streptomyces sp. G-G2]